MAWNNNVEIFTFENRKYISQMRPQLFDFEIVLAKAQIYCAYQERCQWEVKKKLREWQVDDEIQDEIISALITQNFINEERFAFQFAGGKFRIKNWGKLKIKSELKMRQISNYSINKALNSIADEEYSLTLHKLITKKKKEIEARNTFEKNQKIGQYLLAKGYESDLVWEALSLINDDKS